MRIAIIGAGFSGLATTWHLQQKIAPMPRITVFDSIGIGGGASGIAAGLMHPFAGAHSKLNWRGKEAYQATLKLLQISENALGRSVITQKGLLRMAISEEQQKNFFRCSQKYPELAWWNSEHCQTKMPGIALNSGMFIPEAITVDCALYLQGLWQACQQQGAELCIQKIASLQELSAFDVVIVAAGAFSNVFPELAHITITPVKGQLLEIAWPQLPFAVNSQAYMAFGQSAKSGFVGASYERDVESFEPDVEAAKKEIFPKAMELFPDIAHAKILDCRAGVRASMPGHLPVIKHVKPNVWLLSGMGSKGLLYHAFFAEQLSQAVSSHNF